MKQQAKEYQNEYFRNEGYAILENVDAAVALLKSKTGFDDEKARQSIEDDTNCDWVILNDGSVAVLPEALAEAKKIDQMAYQNDFKKKKYDSIEVLVPKGEKQRIKEKAKESGLSLSAYIYNAVKLQMENGGAN